MTEFTLSVVVDGAYEPTVERVRGLLGEVGFGVLTEIDVAATLRAKLGIETVPKVILGACRPQLAHAAIAADPRVATLLPCNVVVTAAGDAATTVEIFDPAAMVAFSGATQVADIATEARERLCEMMERLSVPEGASDATRPR